MKPVASSVQRKSWPGARRGGPADVSADVLALAFVDLQFDDGHVERRVGGASTVHELPAAADIATLEAWGRASAEEWAYDLMCDVAREFTGVTPRDVDEMPCAEVMLEWHCDRLRD